MLARPLRPTGNSDRNAATFTQSLIGGMEPPVMKRKPYSQRKRTTTKSASAIG